MQATTVAEVFIESDHVRVQAEVGEQDLEAFGNILPDVLYERLTGDTSPLATRLPAFFNDDFLIRTSQGPLLGIVEHVALEKRIARDEITGEPLPDQPLDAEDVLRVEIRYRLAGRPTSLTLRPPLDQETNAVSANIGFVVYHQGVAVNDFRYLAQEETLNLDWADPWYSEFERPNLRRQFAAPAAAFLYVEPLEVRKEIIIRPQDLQRFVDLGLTDRKKIAASERSAICRAAADFLNQQTPVEIDGMPRDGQLDRVHFVQRTLRATGIVDPSEEIDLRTALLGAIFVYPVAGLPEEVSLEWKLFNERIARVPCVASDEAGGMPGTMDPSDPRLVWKNFLQNPTLPKLLDVRPPQTANAWRVPWVALLCLGGAALAWRRGTAQAQPSTKEGARLRIGAAILLALGVALFYGFPRWSLQLRLGRPSVVGQGDASDITYALLHNIYRAFDYRDESTIYDVLSQSASGDLLADLYLQVRRSLIVANQGGAQVKVKHIDWESCQTRSEKSEKNDAFFATCQWTVTGAVGHWGHVHQRINRYRGEFRVSSDSGRWRLASLDLLSEERL